MKVRPVRSLRRARLQLERLEARETPAQVIVAVAANTISFTTAANDNAAHLVTVTPTAGNNFLFQGTGGTTFVIGGNDVGANVDTGALGGQFQFVDNGTVGVKVKFLGGNDAFTYDGSVLAARHFADITIDTGSGNDLVVVKQIYAKNLSVLNTGATAAVADTDIITIAAGGRLDLVGGDAIPEPYVGGFIGKVKVDAGTSNDVVTLAVAVKGDVTANFADGNDGFALRGNSRISAGVTVTEAAAKTVGSTVFTINEDSRIGGAVKFDNAGNDVNATVDQSTIGGDLGIKSGTGVSNSQFFINNSTIGGTLDVKGGDKQDTFSALGLMIGKDFKLNLGHGGGTTNFTSTRVGGGATLACGDGNDVFNINNINVAGAVSMNTGKGADHLGMIFSVIGGAFTFTNPGGGNGGTGNHDLLDQTTIGGATTITYDAGGVTFLDISSGILHGQTNIVVENDEAHVVLSNTSFGGLKYKGSVGLDSLTVNSTTVAGGVSFDAAKGVNATFTLGSSIIGGDVTATAAASTGESTFNLNNDRIGGKVTITGSVQKENVTISGVVVNGGVTIDSKGGIGNDNIDNLRVGGSLKITYGAGDDKLGLLNNTVVKDTTIATGTGSDHVHWSAGTIGGNFSLSSAVIPDANQDQFNVLTVGGNFNATIGAGRLNMDSVVVHKTGTFNMAGNKGASFAGAFIANAWFQGGLKYTGGTGMDRMDLTNVVVNGNTDVAMSDGADEINIQGAGRYTGKTTLNVSGPNADNDTIRINAGGTLEITFLGGLQVTTGKGTDTFDIGNGAGLVTILGLTYAEAATDTFNKGPNLVQL